MNNCSFSGRLTGDPKLTSTTGGDVNTKFTLAVERRHGRKQQAAAREANRPTADFIPCSAWKGAATTLANFCKKGDKISVTGSIRTSSYEKDGKRHYGWELEIREFEFDDHRRKANGKPEEHKKEASEAETTSDSVSAEASNSPIPASALEDVPADEIPFF